MAKRIILRTHECVAQRSHTCSSCSMPIIPGDLYEREVIADDHGILMRRKHVNPPCHPDDPDEDHEHEQKTTDAAWELPLAA